MSTLNGFSSQTILELKNYVYRLIDPRNGETFYVGRGVGNRVFQHANGVDPGDDMEGASLKLERILEIKNAKLEVVHVIHRHGMDEDVVKVVEAALIDAYPGLTNIQGGEGSSSYGPMHVQEIESLYALEPLTEELTEKVIFINVNHIENRTSKEAIYQRVRGNWRLDKNRANNADLVVAVYRGVSIGVFELQPKTKWYKSAEKNRYCFDGQPASDDVWKKFVGDKGKRITNNAMRHFQNPIRYWNC